MTPEQQQQFNQELQIVIAVAAQIRPCYDRADSAVLGAMELIQAAERLLKGHYELAKTGSPEAVVSPPVQAAVQPRTSRKVINDSITAASQIIIHKKLKTQDELLTMLQAYGAQSKAQLTDDQAEELLGKLNAILKETK